MCQFYQKTFLFFCVVSRLNVELCKSRVADSFVHYGSGGFPRCPLYRTALDGLRGYLNIEFWINLVNIEGGAMAALRYIRDVLEKQVVPFVQKIADKFYDNMFE